MNVCCLTICFLNFQVLCNVECDKEFILCEYNRDVDSYKFISFFIIIPPVSGFCWIQYA
ncbi:hypothetical protein GLYMA_16G101900v4 [Glycine max]|nr:hypothetical protein GLYMA_16G101900v4 [Glycine max]KAH1150807.1 hypothetical protein GYH30_044698 [Glycine max]